MTIMSLVSIFVGNATPLSIDQRANSALDADGPVLMTKFRARFAVCLMQTDVAQKLSVRIAMHISGMYSREKCLQSKIRVIA